MTRKQLTLLKFISVSVAAYYLYHLSKAQGQTMQGRLNTQKLANLGAQLFPESWRPEIRKHVPSLIDQMIHHGDYRE